MDQVKEVAHVNEATHCNTDCYLCNDRSGASKRLSTFFINLQIIIHIRGQTRAKGPDIHSAAAPIMKITVCAVITVKSMSSTAHG